MTAHEDESAGQDASKTDDGAVSTAEADDKSDENGSGVRDTTEKPEPDEGAKEKAKEMMSAYEDKPTLVMPGSGKTITGTAVNEWLDDDGNPKYGQDEDSPAAKANSESKGSEGTEATGETDKADESRQKGNAGDGEGDGGRAKNTAESERAADANENADDENKSMDQLREEAEQRVKDNMDKDKDFNKEIIEATKKDREEREKADK
jgi:hypothetical protein